MVGEIRFGFSLEVQDLSGRRAAQAVCTAGDGDLGHLADVSAGFSSSGPFSELRHKCHLDPRRVSHGAGPVA